MACYRYIELNPVRANMVESPERYRWSSYQGNVGLLEDPLLTPHYLYDGLGADPRQRQQEYRQLFQKPLTDYQLSELRDSINSGREPGRQAVKPGRRWNN
jgi:putative transposase